MSVRSGQSIVCLFTTRAFSTGVGTNADSLPAGTLYVNGVSNAATVTVTNVTTGVYKAAVTMPTLAVGDVVDLRISATVSSVADNAVVWRDTKDILLDGSGDVALDLTQEVPTSNTAQTVGDALNAARAQGFGKWAISGTTLTLYASDGTTVVRTFALDSATYPTSRT